MQILLTGILLAGAMAAVTTQAGDRVYTADQTSNTVSVIDPATNKLLGAIHLGQDVPAALSPLYSGELLVHGLGFSPDHKTLDVVSIGSNSVTLIDTETNAVKGKIYVGRSPHEAFFRPDGRELWVAVRGENYISVIDPVLQREVRRIETANGPGWSCRVGYAALGEILAGHHEDMFPLYVCISGSGYAVQHERNSTVSPVLGRDLWQTQNHRWTFGATSVKYHPREDSKHTGGIHENHRYGAVEKKRS